MKKYRKTLDKQKENFNGAGLVVKANNALRDNLLAIDKTTQSATSFRAEGERKSA